MRIVYFFAGLLGEPSSLGIPDQAASNASIDRVTDLVFMVAGATAVILVIIAGIYYSLSIGEPQKIAKAKDMIFYSVIGLIVVASAFTIVKFILGRFN